MRPSFNMIIRFLDSFLSQELLLIARDDRRLRARVLVGIAFLTVITPALLVAINYKSSTNYLLSLFSLSTIGFLSLSLVRFKSETRFSSFILVSAIWSALCYGAVVESVFFSISFIWFPLIVSITVYLLGVRPGGFVTLLLIGATYGVFQYIQAPRLILGNGIRLDEYVQTYLGHIILSCLATYMVTVVFDITQRNLQFDLFNRQSNLKDWNAFLKRNIKQKTETLEELNSKLVESEKKYFTLYNTAPDMFMSLEAPSFRITECNDTCSSVLGYSRLEILEKSIFDFFDQESIELAGGIFANSSNADVVEDQELNFITKDGEKLEVSVSASAVFDTEGEIISHTLVIRDITNRKIAQRKLDELNRTLEERVEIRTQEVHNLNNDYELILNSVPALILYKDCNNNILRANKAVADDFGLEPKDLVNKPLADLYGEQLAHEIYQDDLEVIKSQKARLGKVQSLKLPNGDSRWLKSDKLPIYDQSGDVSGVIVFAHDITKQKEAEMALAKRTQDLSRYDRYLKRIHQTVTYNFSDPQDKFVECLRLGKEMLGFDYGLLTQLGDGGFHVQGVSSKISFFQQGEFIEGVSVMHQKIVNSEDMFLCQDYSLISESEFCPFALRYNVKSFIISPLWVNGRLWGAVSFGSTTKKNHEFSPMEIELTKLVVETISRFINLDESKTALMESEVRFRKIFESTANAVMIVDKEGRIETYNPATAGIFNLDYEDLKGRNIGEIIPANVEDEDGKSFKNYSSLKNQSLIGLHKDGKGIRKGKGLIDLEINVNPFNFGEESKFLWIVRDISQKKEYERKLIEARELALSASKAKSQFLSNMSHEIRTPLNSIIGVAEILREATKGDDEIEKYVDLFSRSSNSLLMIVNDILDLSKIEAGEINLEEMDLDLKDLIKTVSEMASIQVKKKDLNFKWKYDDSIPKYVLGDPTRLRQILSNLISNAVKFTETGEIKLEVTQVSKDYQGSRIRFAVSDTGIGISKEVQNKIFSPFVQENASTTRKYGGTGLGLSICKKLAELMDGEIGLESEPGEGTTFFFEIPMEKSDKKDDDISLELTHGAGLKSVKEVHPEEFYRPLKILVAEDSPDNQMVLKVYFKKFPFEVTYVENGQLAVDEFRKNKFDLILMDMQMPEMDGETALKIIRKEEEEKELLKTPIFALTANALREQEIHSLSLGFDKHISKPIKKNYLIKQILEVLEMENLKVELDTSFDPELAEFVPEYIENRFEDLDLLKAAIEGSEFDNIDRICHRVLGTAQNYGLHFLDKLLSQMKAASKEEDAFKCKTYVETLEDYLLQMRENLAQKAA